MITETAARRLGARHRSPFRTDLLGKMLAVEPGTFAVEYEHRSTSWHDDSGSPTPRNWGHRRASRKPVVSSRYSTDAAGQWRLWDKIAGFGKAVAKGFAVVGAGAAAADAPPDRTGAGRLA